MKLMPIYSDEVSKTLAALDFMIRDRKLEIDDIIHADKDLTFLYGNNHRRKRYYEQDDQLKQLTEERNRIIAIAIPEDYMWSK